MVRRFLLAAFLVLGAAASTVTPPVAHAADVTPQQLYDLRAELPYVHIDRGGRRWIYGASTTNSSGYRQMQSVITQNYGGEWHVVGFIGGANGTFTQRAIGSVLCTGGRTSYPFRTVGQVWYGGRWYSTYSGIKSLDC